MAEIDLSWTASTDNVAVAGYRIRRGGVVVATVDPVTSYADTNLPPSTTYSYTVQAFDAAGNTSAESSSASATTTSGSGGTPPSGFFITPDDDLDGFPLLRDLRTSSAARGGAPLYVYGGSSSPSTFQSFLDSLPTSMAYVGLPWGMRVDGSYASTIRLSKPNKYFFPVDIPSSYTPGGEPAIVRCRLVVPQGVSDVTLDWLNLDITHTGGNTSGFTIGGPHCTLRRSEIYQSHPAYGTIGISPIQGSQWGPGDYFTMQICRVHDIGQWPVANTSSSGFYMHGAYMQTVGVIAEDVWFWNCSRAGLLLRGAQHGLFRYITADRCGTALAFGDLNSADNEVHHFIGTNSLEAGHNDDYGASVFQTGSGNTLHDSNFYGNSKGDYDPGLGGIRGANTLSLDPAYVHGCPAGGVSGGSYASGDPTLIDLRPTNSTLVVDGMGARLMIPSFL